jgi:hypothetical protein
MSISFEKFVDWAEKRFDNIRVGSSEVKINSIFCDDTKRKLWCNPFGGKKGRENGVYRCWKTDKRGSLVSLVMQVEGCTYEQALDILGGVDLRLSTLEQKVDELFNNPKLAKFIEEEEEISTELELPPFTFRMDELAESNYYRSAAEIYLQDRCLPPEKFMICMEGDYKNRIIIPYYDRQGSLIYYNGRDLNPNTKVKYLGPPGEVGVGKGDVLYFPEWPTKKGTVYLTEGEFDAYSIFLSGLIAGAFGGKTMSEKQLLMLDDYNIVLCLDNDSAGRKAIAAMSRYMIANGYVAKMGCVFPPKGVKDWNELLKKVGPNILKEYILKATKPITEDTLIEWEIAQL